MALAMMLKQVMMLRHPLMGLRQSNQTQRAMTTTKRVESGSQSGSRNQMGPLGALQ